MLHSICRQLWETQQWPQDWKRSVFIPISKKGNVKECSNYYTIALISHASEVMLKILQARFQQSSIQFSSVTQSCPALCEPMDCSTPGFPIHRQLPELAQIQFHPTISSSVIPFSSCLQSFPASGSFPMSQFFASGG